jgi:acylphosphatase
MNRCRMQILYAGHVQGVGFRYTVRTEAMGYEVTGMVRNLPDGRVELVAEGDKSELESFQTAILDSGLGSLVRQTQIHWGEATGEFRGFVVAH